MTEEEIQRIRAARTQNWYVLYTAPRAEKRVEERLRERKPKKEIGKEV